MAERNLKNEMQELGIISFDADGITTKEDVFIALDAIRNHVNANPNSETLRRIDELVEAKNKRRFQGADAE